MVGDSRKAGKDIRCWARASEERAAEKVRVC